MTFDRAEGSVRSGALRQESEGQAQGDLRTTLLKDSPAQELRGTDQDHHET